MQKLNERVEPSAPVLVMAHPGTREERIYLIRNAYVTASGAWFHCEERLPRGTYIKIVFRLKYSPDQKAIKVVRYGRVVNTGFMGFSVDFDS